MRLTVSTTNGVRSWLALYVKPRHEKYVVLALTGKGYECFLPIYQKHHARSKSYDLPLFPSYVFCRSTISDTRQLRSTPGVFFIVGDAAGPRPVPDVDIDQVKSLLTSGLPVSPWPHMPIGQEIYFESGPLRGIRGRIVNLSQDKWVIVSVDMLERSVAAKLNRASLETGAIRVSRLGVRSTLLASLDPMGGT
jgi:transcription antitermination factor NusG